MAAVQDFSVAVDETGKRLLGSCPGPKTTLTRVALALAHQATGSKHGGRLCGQSGLFTSKPNSSLIFKFVPAGTLLYLS